MNYIFNTNTPFRDEWAEEMLPLHPEYCRYEVCMEQVPSRVFDAALMTQSGWGAPFATWQDVLGDDPYFSGAVHNCTTPPYADMLAKLTNYCANNCDPLSASGDIMNFITQAQSAGANVDSWTMFRGIYLSLKESYRYTDACKCYNFSVYPTYWSSYNTDCPNRVLQEPSAGGTNWFDINAGNLTGSTGSLTVANTAQCASICAGRVQGWMSEITAICTINNSTDRNNLVAALTSYCEGSCGTTGANPMGYLLQEDISNPGSIPYNQYLITAQGILNTLACSTALSDIASSVQRTEVYEPLNINGANVYTYVDPQRCTTLSCVFSFLNDRVFNAAIIPTTGGHIWTRTGTTAPISLNSLERDWSSIASNCPGTGPSTLSCLSSAYGNSSTVTLSNVHNYGEDIENYPTFSLDRSIKITHPNLTTPNTCVAFSFEFISQTGEKVNPLEIRAVNNYDCAANSVTLTMRDNSTMIAFIAIGDAPCVPAWETNSTVAWTPIVETIPIDEDFVMQECLNAQIAQATEDAQNLLNNLINETLTTLINATACENVVETFTMRHSTTEHHYMLYYYDQAGDLVQTVSPAGVNSGRFARVSASGQWNTSTALLNPVTGPNDYTKYEIKYQTRFKYNSLGQPVESKSPDRGVVTFHYDYLQRLRFTQNVKQQPNKKFSYIKFDKLGRTVETGEFQHSTVGISAADKDNIDFPSTGRTEQSFIVYDQLSVPNPYFAQANTRNRVVMVYNKDQATYYDYDVHGNVRAVQQQIRQFGAAEMRYEYNLWSGNVDKVAFQPGTVDQFYHSYRYDADNRVSRVMTSNDNNTWTTEARYFYYAHGPLARVELGEDKVQGLDYYYSIHGWLKGINNTNTTIDPGKDGQVALGSNLNSYTPQDEMAFYLGYYDGDYTPINNAVDMGGFRYSAGSAGFGADILGTGTGANPKGLYNGNIAWTTTHLPELTRKVSTANATQTNVYQYDALHRIRNAFSYSYAGTGTNWNNNTQGTDAYDSEYRYDRDGNIKTLKRYAGQYGLIDNMTYSYVGTIPNQLASINDATTTITVPSSISVTDDIEGLNTYSYDALGNLIGNGSECIQTIEWNTAGKVTKVIYNQTCTLSPNKPTVIYTYDAAGNRIAKETRTGNLANTLLEKTVYVRDASGTEMATYKIIGKQNTTDLSRELDEIAIYGMSRIGVVNATNFVKSSTSNTKTLTLVLADWPSTVMMNAVQKPLALALGVGPYKNVNSRGYKRYELSNHLGNVLAVVTDRKMGTDTDADARANYYSAAVFSVSDYYPFGWEMPGRTHTNHRFSVNGMEKSPEIASGHNTSYFRELDARTGRWWSTDPVWQPWESPYATFGNNPILLADPSGALPVDPAGKSKGKKDKGERKKERKERRANRRERWKNWAQGRQYINDAEDYIRDHGIDPSQVTRYEDEIRVGEYISKPTIITTDPDGTTSIYVDYDKVIRKFRRRPLKERLLDGLQTGLAIIGTIPVLGEAADLLDAGISALRGDYVGAAMSLASAVPIWGWVARSGKVARGVLKGGRKGHVEDIGKGSSKTGPGEELLEQNRRRENGSDPSAPKVKTCGCFTAGTLVKTSTGYKAIESVVVGDTVWAYNDTTGVLSLKEVVHIMKVHADSLIKIHVNGSWIEATNEHPFYSKGRWVDARDLKTGDSLLLYSMLEVVVDSILIETGSYDVYNFTVDGFHTYFVSSTDVLVHNCDFEPVDLRGQKGGKEINAEIKVVVNGGGNLRKNDDGTPKLYENRNNSKQDREWAGAEEYTVTVEGAKDVYRILKRSDGNGGYIYGWTGQHYSPIYYFKPKVK